jgi:hypothetical protein
MLSIIQNYPCDEKYLVRLFNELGFRCSEYKYLDDPITSDRNIELSNYIYSYLINKVPNGLIYVTINGIDHHAPVTDIIRINAIARTYNVGVYIIPNLDPELHIIFWNSENVISASKSAQNNLCESKAEISNSIKNYLVASCNSLGLPSYMTHKKRKQIIDMVFL